MFLIDRTSIDKSLPVPVGQQLYGLLAYAISYGDMPSGARLPSVRDLASEIGLATMTVNKVYKDLRNAGLIEIRHGLGTFVARNPSRNITQGPESADLRRRIDDLVAQAIDLSVPPDELLSMISSQMQARRLRLGLKLVFVGIFEGPARDYVDEIRPFLANEDQIDVTTIDALRADPDLRRTCIAADAVLTFLHRQAEVEGVLAGARVLALRFIPSEATRRALAGLDSRDRIAAVTRFQEYIAIMRPSIRQFAPHVSDIQVTWSEAPDLAGLLKGRDIVVYATGADNVTALLSPGVRHFEYRHSPDPGELSRLLVPFLSNLRSERATMRAVSASQPRRTSDLRQGPRSPQADNSLQRSSRRGQ